MIGNHAKIAQQLSEHLCREYGSRVHVEPLPDVDFKKHVGDATYKFLATAPDGKPGFLLLSSAGNPELVGRAVHNIQTVTDLVTPEVGKVILQPSYTGALDGHDFAIWPAQKPFHSNNRLVKRVRAKFYANAICGWAEMLVADTLTDGMQAAALSDLEVVVAEPLFPPDMRAAAQTVINRVKDEAWVPKNCVQHGDFHIGNIVLPRERGDITFFVIDWAGMRLNAYPFWDTLRILISLGCDTRACQRHFQSLRQVVDCDERDILAYILCSVGQIGQNLEFFPPDRYRAAAIRAYQFVLLK